MEKISRQRRWQLKMERKGRCRVCGKLAIEGKKVCPYHNEKQKEYNRNKRLNKIQNGI